MTERMDETYWINLPVSELGEAVKERFSDYIEELEALGRLGDMRLAHRRYYGENHSGTGTSARVSHGGEQGETSELVGNHYRSITTSLVSLTTSSTPAFKATASDDTAEAMTQVELSDQIWAHELSNGAEVELVDAVRRMLILQEAGVGVFWDAAAGDPIMQEPEMVYDPVMGEVPAESRPVYEGELVVQTFSPYDVARDLGARSFRDIAWQIVRVPVSKWELVALYPEFKEEILATPTVGADDLKTGLWKGLTSQARHRTTDYIYALHLYAKRTRAVPDGRYALVVGDQVLESGPLQYERLPVVLVAPEPTIGTALGSAATNDLLAPQEAYDSVMSNLLSNNDAWGRSNILSAKGQDVDVKDLGGGLQQVEYEYMDGAPPPAAMNLPRLSDADMKFADALQQLMQTLSAINDVVRGDPQASLKSGAALALVQAMAVQHNSPIQKAYAIMLKEVATRIIETYRVFATTERVIEVTGTNERRTVQRFVGSDLSQVRSVHVELGSPLMRTIAGKKELADALTDPSKAWPDEPMTREQYIAFLETGRLQPLVRADKSEAIAIREECEALMKGEPVQVLASDHHAAHIREHKALLDGRGRLSLPPEAINEISQHIGEHVTQWAQLSQMNPALLVATGQQPAPMPMMPMGPPMPGGEGGPPPGPGGPPAGPPPNGGPPMADVEVGAPEGVQGPQMPVNPATGERVDAPGGLV